MTATRIAVVAGEPRARVQLGVGALAPRLVSRRAAYAHVVTAAAGMMLLGGDRVQVVIEVGAGCTLELEDVGGTVAYRGAPSQWEVDAEVGEGATLLWRSLPFVVTDGAETSRRTSVRLGRGARAVIRETLVLGRHGERGGRLTAAMSIVDEEGPLVVERLDVDGHAPEPGVLGGHRVLDAVIAGGFRPPTGPGDLEFDGPGATARHLSGHAHGSPLERVWDEWIASAISQARGTETS